MYLQHSWNILRVSSCVRNVQSNPRIYSSYKVLIKPQVTKLDPSHQEKSNQTGKLKEIEFVNFGDKISPSSSNKLVESLKDITVTSTNKKWRDMEVDTSKLGHYYLRLSKFRLTSLVVITSVVGYAMSPSQFDIISFMSCVLGTGLVSSAANSVNQFLEIPFDAQMSRTRNRVLVQGHLSPLHAFGFATITGTLGLLILYEGTNNLTATLGASNLILYTMVYTPLKRISIVNTWIGSVVGAIPPLMGWAACEGNLELGALILGGILYAWQFPHFNALSWNLRPDYSKAGYRMMSVTNPSLCRKTALRYTLGITAFSSLAPFFNLTHWFFGILSLPINLYFVYLGFKFYKNSDSKNSRRLFRFSLIQLPLLLGLMLISKEGLFSFSNQSKKKNSEELVQKKNNTNNSFVTQLRHSDKNKFSSSEVFHASV